MSSLSLKSKEYFQLLLNQAIDAASFLLSKNKEFYPFGVILNQQGKIALYESEVDQERPLSQDIIDRLTIEIGRMNDVRAAAIVAMATETKGLEDVIRIDFDHVSNDMMQVLVPYKLKGLKKKLELGEAIFTEGNKRIVRVFK